MRVMVFGMATESSEQDAPPTAEAFAAMERFTEELVQAGVLVAGAGLKPTGLGKRILFDGPNATVMDGPFAETKEVVAGFSIWDVKDVEEAVAWARRSPAPTAGPRTIEIRPFFEAADFADIAAAEEPLREGERGKLGVA